MKSQNDTSNEIVATLNNSTNGLKNKKRILIWIIAIILIASGVKLWLKTDNKQTIRYETKPASRETIIVTVTATGTLEPTNEVEVGSELSGIIKEVNVDYNDNVKIGQLLARLDVSKLQSQVIQTKAALESAKAQVLQAQATIEETQSKLSQLETVRKLSEGKVPSQTILAEARAAYARALANKAGAEASVAEVQASLDINQTDLSKADIISPINGVVLSRNIEVGQTVAASFEAPVLFKLAEDLTKMELHVDVDEADIGLVKTGQQATFTVDAYPNRLFDAKIRQVRYASTTTDGVVTYETILTVDNADFALRPGMTATSEIVVQKVENTLVVPITALRFAPSAVETPKQSRSIVSSILPQPPREEKQQQVYINGNRQSVWVLKNGIPVEIEVETGLTDGIRTQVVKGEIEQGAEVIIDALATGRK